MANKILVVDDEAHIRMLYTEELAEEGYEIITAEGGLNLLERIEAEKPNLVVLDIKMVDYNGLDLLQDIRNKFYDLPVILCSESARYLVKTALDRELPEVAVLSVPEIAQDFAVESIGVIRHEQPEPVAV